MVNTAALKERVLARAEVIAGAAGQIMVDRLLEAAGEGLRRDAIALTGPERDGTRIVEKIAIDQAQVVTQWQWDYGDSEHSFDPHLNLAGVTFDETNYADVLDNGGFFAAKPYWFPGDHAGCRCAISNISGDALFPGAGPSSSTVRLGGFVIEVQRDQSVMRAAGVPDWWAATLTSAQWRSSLAEAQR